MIKILIFHPELQFLDQVEKLFKGWSKGNMFVYKANTVGHVLRTLQNIQIDVFLASTAIPAIDGLEFIRRIYQHYRHVHICIMATREQGQSNPIPGLKKNRIFEEPHGVSEMLHLYTGLSQVARERADEIKLRASSILSRSQIPNASNPLHSRLPRGSGFNRMQ